MIKVLRFAFWSSTNPKSPYHRPETCETMTDHLDRQLEGALNELHDAGARIIDINSSEREHIVMPDGCHARQQRHRIIVNMPPSHPYRDPDTRREE